MLADDFADTMDWTSEADLRRLVKLSRSQKTWTPEGAEVFAMTAMSYGHTFDLVNSIMESP